MDIILFSYLFMNAWTDLKRKEIDILYTIVFVVIGVVYKFVVQGTHYWNGMIPGMALCLLAFIWKEHIGIGDGIIVMAFGWMCGLTLVCEVLTGGFVLAAGAGIVCYIFGGKVNVELPFIPFFLGSYVMC